MTINKLLASLLKLVVHFGLISFFDLLLFSNLPECLALDVLVEVVALQVVVQVSLIVFVVLEPVGEEGQVPELSRVDAEETHDKAQEPLS